MSTHEFSAIAERSFLLRGPAERTVVTRTGTWEGSPWQLAVPLWISADDMGQYERARHFLKTDFWKRDPGVNT